MLIVFLCLKFISDFADFGDLARAILRGFASLDRPSMASTTNQQITIDGPSASGKSTIAKLLADELNAIYVNTGEMYRALTAEALRNQLDPEIDPDRIVNLLDQINLQLVRDQNNDNSLTLYLNDSPVEIPLIRSPEVTAKVSFAAKIPEVRDWMVRRQRETKHLGLIVMEGRDIGTVIFPRAKYKFFITASPEERARRRLAQAGEVPDGATIETVASEITERDRLDATRKVAPLRPADDAVSIDTTGQKIDAIVRYLASTIHNRIRGD